jgi:hypothetical protein
MFLLRRQGRGVIAMSYMLIAHLLLCAYTLEEREREREERRQRTEAEKD